MVVMIPTGDLYLNTQVYFAEHILKDLPNDERQWEKAYRDWLFEQGAVVVKPEQCGIGVPLLIRNSLGIAPGYDHFGFSSSRLAEVFVLRWS